MINKQIFHDIFKYYPFKKVVFIDSIEVGIFVLSEMSSNISIERWDYLENILSDYTNKKVQLCVEKQIIKVLGKEFINKGEIVYEG